MRQPIVGERTRSTSTLWLVVALLVLSTVSWRRGQYYSGGIDPVVAAKGAMDMLALVIATVHTFITRRRRYLRSTAAMWFLLLFVVVSLFGATYTQTTLLASSVLAGRLIVIAVVCFQLLRDYAVREVLRALIATIGLITAVAVLTELLPKLARAGGSGNPLANMASVFTATRLSGNLPPLGPNEVAELAGFVVVALMWRIVQGEGGKRSVFGAGAFLAIIYLTGSRTGLVAAVVAIALMMLLARRLPIGLVIATILALPVLVYIAFGTGVLARFLGRGGEANLTTLNNRSVAWEAALNLHQGFWNIWFGNGLSQASIPVVAKFRDQQILDSSWISALVQGGVLGVIALALWVLYGSWVAARSPRPFRLYATATMTFIGLRTFLESGLPGATPAFLLFFVISVACGGLSMVHADSLVESDVLPARRRAQPVVIAPLDSPAVGVGLATADRR